MTEIIIVDTGSTDRTKEIAAQFGAKILDFTWIGDFAAARNFCIKHATQPWILNFDPDERLAAHDLLRVKELTNRDDIDGFSFTIRNYSTNSSQTFFYPCRSEYPEFEQGQSGYFETNRIKLFRNNRGIHFVGAVHELVETTVKGKVEKTDIPVHHFGELQAEKIRKSKHSVYFPILKKKAEDNPNDWKPHFELGTEYVGVENFSEALKCFEKALSLSHYPQIYSHLGHSLFVCGNLEEAEKVYQSGISVHPFEHDIRYNYASMKMSENKWLEALHLLAPLTNAHPDSFLAQRAVGYCLLNLEKINEAEKFLEQALKLFPSYEDARVDLGILRFMQGKKQEAIAEAKKTLEYVPNSPRAEGLLKAIEANS